MLAFGLAGLRAGRLDCRVNDLGVTLGFALRDLTNRAGLRSCAGSILPLVPLGRDFRLCNENRITNRAVLAFGLAGSRAGGRNCRVSDLGVTLGRDLRLCNENLITNRAVLALGLAGLCAGGRNCRVNGLGVCSLLNRFVRPAYLGLTNRAIHDLIVAAFFCASGSDFIFPDCFPGSVPLGQDFLLCNENLIADRAVLSLSLAGLCAGRLDCRVNGLGVCSLLNRFVRPAYLGLTNRAIHDLIVAAFFCASGSDFIFPDCFPGSVPLGGDLLLCNENLSADRAVLALGLAGHCTGRLDCRIGDLGVTVGLDRLRPGRITDAAGEGPHAGDCAGCGGGDSAGVPGVILSFGDRCAVFDLFFAVRAIGIAGIALLSAGGRLEITNLGLGVRTRRFAAPNAVYIVDRSPGFRALCRGVAAVLIAQLGRGDGDVIIC